jgi:hypothetical protein
LHNAVTEVAIILKMHFVRWHIDGREIDQFLVGWWISHRNIPFSNSKSTSGGGVGAGAPRHLNKVKTNLEMPAKCPRAQHNTVTEKHNLSILRGV